jgi:hypothetical protein
MDATDSLNKKLLAETSDFNSLKELGVINSGLGSTTTTPYPFGGNPINLQTTTSNSDVLHAIEQLRGEVKNGFEKVMAKLSDTPVKTGGGAQNISQQPVEMSESTTTESPSFINGIKNTLGFGSPPQEPISTSTRDTSSLNDTLTGGRRKRTRKSRRRLHRRSSRHRHRSRRH